MRKTESTAREEQGTLSISSIHDGIRPFPAGLSQSGCFLVEAQSVWMWEVLIRGLLDYIKSGSPNKINVHIMNPISFEVGY